MIFVFRKEIRKWNKVWWFVIASLAFGSVSFFFMKRSDKDAIGIATVNGKKISLKTFHQAYAEVKSSLDDLAMYWGIPVDRLAKMTGIEDMGKHALSQCVQNVLVGDLVGQFNMSMDAKSFQEGLSATVSKAFVDRTGKINLQAYQNYLSRLHMTISEYEGMKEAEFYRNMFIKFIVQSAYAPRYAIDEMLEQKNMKKSFTIMTMPFSTFLEAAKTQAIPDDELKKFFKEKQEMYRVQEKRKVKYLQLTPEEYKEKVDIDDEIVERFYEKSKSTLYRIPPKVKVRVAKFSDRKEAEEFVEKIKQTPELFEKESELIDFFQRGTHDPEFEKVAFLKLKNTGDMSEIVTTEKGFEIIRLEDRIAASQKPLSEVRDEVVEAIKNRRALIVLKGDLEAVMRSSKSDKDIFEKFSTSNNFKVHESDWLTKAEAQGYEVLDAIAGSVFSGSKKAHAYGYFVHRGKHILYKETEREKSYIPQFETVEQQVKDDWYEQKAGEQQEKMVKKLRVELSSQGTIIDTIAKTHGFGVITTPPVKVDGEVAALKNAGDIIASAFALTDPSQVLEYKFTGKSAFNPDYYLVRLIMSEKGDAVSEEARDAQIKSQKIAAEQRHLTGFIASLQRNATIKLREDIVTSMGSM